MLLASALGAAGFIWWITALISMVFPNKRAAAWRLLMAVALTWTVNEFMLKPLVDRARPFEVDTSVTLIDARPTTAAFPSGHAAMAVAGAVAGSRLIPWSAWAWWPLAAIIAVSRVYLGVHWPSDVLVGALIGLGMTWFVLGGRPNPPEIHSTRPH